MKIVKYVLRALVIFVIAYCCYCFYLYPLKGEPKGVEGIGALIGAFICIPIFAFAIVGVMGLFIIGIQNSVKWVFDIED
jgi:hypothetical protein